MKSSDKPGAHHGGTRGRIVAHLRRGERTVDELAAEVGTTDNSVRAHLTALERDGVIRQEGVRRSPGAGKPAVVYGIHPAIESSFSNAYPPVLNALLDVLIAELPGERAMALLEAVGHRLALGSGGRRAPAKGSATSGELRERVQVAADLLIALGGDVEVVEDGSRLLIRGFGCPLSLAVVAHPESCHAVTTMVSDVTGATVEQCCEHGERPRCGFKVGDSTPTSAIALT